MVDAQPIPPVAPVTRPPVAPVTREELMQDPNFGLWSEESIQYKINNPRNAPPKNFVTVADLMKESQAQLDRDPDLAGTSGWSLEDREKNARAQIRMNESRQDTQWSKPEDKNKTIVIAAGTEPTVAQVLSDRPMEIMLEGGSYVKRVGGDFRVTDTSIKSNEHGMAGDRAIKNRKEAYYKKLNAAMGEEIDRTQDTDDQLWSKSWDAFQDPTQQRFKKIGMVDLGTNTRMEVQVNKAGTARDESDKMFDFTGESDRPALLKPSFPQPLNSGQVANPVAVDAYNEQVNLWNRWIKTAATPEQQKFVKKGMDGYIDIWKSSVPDELRTSKFSSNPDGTINPLSGGSNLDAQSKKAAIKKYNEGLYYGELSRDTVGYFNKNKKSSTTLQKRKPQSNYLDDQMNDILYGTTRRTNKVPTKTVVKKQRLSTLDKQANDLLYGTFKSTSSKPIKKPTVTKVIKKNHSHDNLMNEILYGLPQKQVSKKTKKEGKFFI